MIKKSIALCMLSLALSCQSSLAVSVENQSQTSSITIKSNIKSEDSLKSEFVEVVPGAFKRVGMGNSKTPRKLSAEEIELLKAQSQKRANQRLLELHVNVNIRMYNFDDVQCTVIPSVAYGFVTGMNLQLC